MNGKENKRTKSEKQKRKKKEDSRFMAKFDDESDSLLLSVEPFKEN